MELSFIIEKFLLVFIIFIISLGVELDPIVQAPLDFYSPLPMV